jgi:hypothetical protein
MADVYDGIAEVIENLNVVLIKSLGARLEKHMRDEIYEAMKHLEIAKDIAWTIREFGEEHA